MRPNGGFRTGNCNVSLGFLFLVFWTEFSDVFSICPPLCLLLFAVRCGVMRNAKTFTELIKWWISLLEAKRALEKHQEWNKIVISRAALFMGICSTLHRRLSMLDRMASYNLCRLPNGMVNGPKWKINSSYGPLFDRLLSFANVRPDISVWKFIGLGFHIKGLPSSGHSSNAIETINFRLQFSIPQTHRTYRTTIVHTNYVELFIWPVPNVKINKFTRNRLFLFVCNIFIAFYRIFLLLFVPALTTSFILSQPNWV